MKRPLTLILLLLLPGATLACYLPRFGPTDRGGFFLVFAVKADEAQLAQSIEQTMAVFQRRCNQLGLYCKAQRQEGGPPNRVMLRVSGTKDAAKVKSVMLASGLELRAVVSPSYPAPIPFYPTRELAEKEARAAGGDVMPYAESDDAALGAGESFIVVERAVIVGGNDIRNAEAVEMGKDTYSINFTLRPEAAVRFGAWTRASINRYLAVVLNGRVHTAPYIKGEITDQGQIDGNFTRARAEETALVLNTGNLPAPVELLEEGTYKP